MSTWLNHIGNSMPLNYVQKIEDAQIYDLAVKTPVDDAPLLSQRLNNRVLLKREDLQPVFSFKLRGAYNKLLNLSKQQLATGVVAASAGNHAQGLALASKKNGYQSDYCYASNNAQNQG